MVHNRPVIEDRMPRVADAIGLSDSGSTSRSAFDSVLEWTVDLRAQLGLPATLEGVVSEEQISSLVRMASQDPSLGTNPKPCSEAEIEDVLRKTIAGDLSV
jgi:alcohol dehydrogenase class IV